MRLAATITLSITSLVLVLSAGLAAACEPAPARRASYPPYDARDVPLDTIVLALGAASLTRASTGENLPADVVPFHGTTLLTALRPRAPLPPDEDIVVGGTRKFRTGMLPSRPPAAWTLRSATSRYVDPQNGCGLDEPCGHEHFLDVRAETDAPERADVLVLFAAPQPGPYDPAWPVAEVIEVPAGAERTRDLHFPVMPGRHYYLAPISSAGALGPMMGPLRYDEGDGCALGTTPRRAHLPLPFVVLALAALTGRWRARRR